MAPGEWLERICHLPPTWKLHGHICDSTVERWTVGTVRTLRAVLRPHYGAERVGRRNEAQLDAVCHKIRHKNAAEASLSLIQALSPV